MSKYIETHFPIGEVSRLAERESWRKEIYRPVYYLHKWWARRLGSVFRAITLAACLNDDEDLMEHFYRSQAFHSITVFDPFMGSGVAVGEAAKLGCRVIGRDINQVAATIVQASLNNYDIDTVHHHFRNIEIKVKPYIQGYYQTKLSSGEFADVLYFFLVKFIHCPACQRKIQLFKSRLFSKNAMPRKDSTARAICPHCGGINHIRYDDRSVCCSICQQTYNPQKGAVQKGHVSCPFCQTSIKLVDYLKTISHPLAHDLYAKLVLYPDGSKRYDPINQYDLDLLRQADEEFSSLAPLIRTVPLKAGYNTNQVLKYNYTSWDQMFTKRQHLCVHKLSEVIKDIDNITYRTLFACLLSGTLEFNNVFSSFKGEGTGAVRHMFAHHILKPELMPIEANLWGTPKSSGAFSTLYESRLKRALAYKMAPFELKISQRKSHKVHQTSPAMNYQVVNHYEHFKLSQNQHQSEVIYISQGDSSKTDLPDQAVEVVITDPPFFDNVHYSQLADFFFYWLNDLLDLSDIQTTRHQAEVQDTDTGSYTQKLKQIFVECHRVLKQEGLLIFTYHHARHEGWTSVYKAIREAGFKCLQSYPIKAEMSVAMPIQQAKIPIHLDLILVCKKQDEKLGRLHTEKIYRHALAIVQTQLQELANSQIDVSVGDAKITLIGRLLCELSQVNDFQGEIDFLQSAEQEINQFISDLLQAQTEPIYKITEHPKQLTLFESLGDYLLA